MKVWVSRVTASNYMWITSSQEVIWEHLAVFATEESAKADNDREYKRALEDAGEDSSAEVYEMEVQEKVCP